MNKMPDNMKQQIIGALKWGADEWDKTAIDPEYFHSCRLCKIIKNDCIGCPLLITGSQPRSGECANWGRYYDAWENNDIETEKKEAAILAGVMRWEAYKLENEQ